MFTGFISHAIFDFVKKKVPAKRVKLCYFLASGICFLLLALVLALFMVIGDSDWQIIKRFLTLSVIAGFLLGELYAAVGWFLRHRKEM